MTLNNLALMFGPNWLKSPQGDIGDLNDAAQQSAVALVILEAPPGSEISIALGISVASASTARSQQHQERRQLEQQHSPTSPSSPNSLRSANSPRQNSRLASYPSSPREHEGTSEATTVIKSFAIEEAFSLADNDRDGKIDRAEFETMIRALGYIVDSTKLNEFFAAADKDHDNAVNLDQIRKLVRSQYCS